MAHLRLRGVLRRAFTLAVLPLIVLMIVLSPLLSAVAQTTPQLALSATSALPGTPVTAMGTGFPAGGTGQLLWSDGTPIAAFGIDAAGAFALEIVVPEVAPGPYTLAAMSDDGAAFAETTITVEAPAEPVLPPTESETGEAPPVEPAAPEPTLEPTPPYYPIVASGHSDTSPDAGVVYDGDPSTVWLTDPVAPAEAWLTLDLGAVLPIGSARWLLATAGTVSQLEIQLSEDGAHWASLATLDGATLPVGAWSEQPVNVWARYVRFQVPNPNGLAQLGGFAEIEVWPAADARPISAIVTPAPTEVVEPTVAPTTEPIVTDTAATPDAETAAASPEASPQVARSMASAALPGDSLSLPLRAAFYYPWFPGAWHQKGVNPYTIYEPTRGYYDGGDSAVVSGHIADMQYGGIDVGIASWWGQGTREDVRMPQLLSAASGTGFKWTVYYEDEGFGNPSVDTLRADLEYLRDQYAADPNYLRIDGRFVVFAYGGGESCEMADRWAQANESVNAFIVLKVFDGYKSCGNQPDSWHQYAPAVAADSQGSHSYTISPGFHLYGDVERLPRDLARWQQSVRDMVASGADWQLVTTYNEWGEGTSVESAAGWESESGYGQYLDVLHANGEGALPGESAAAPTQEPTIAPTVAPTTPARPAPTEAAGGTLTFTPVADSRVKSSSPSKNYGTEPKIGADQDPEETGYLRFDLNGLSGAPGKAVLRLWVTDSTSDAPKVVTVGDTRWSETGITWSNRPATGTVIADVGNAPAGTWIEYDVTSAIAGNGLVSFGLQADSTNGIDVASREASADVRPQLVISGEDGATESEMPSEPVPGEKTEPTPEPTTAPANTPTVAPTNTPAVVPTTAPTTTPTVVPTTPATPTATATPGDPQTLSPVADARVKSGSPSKNYGTEIKLGADQDPEETSYLRFDVQGLSAAPEKAVLRLWVTDSSSNGPRLATVTDTTWSETGITWNNRPATGPVIGDVGNANLGQWIEYDVTSAIAGNGPVSFALLPDSTNGIDVASREASAEQRPQLVLNPDTTIVAPAPEPTEEPAREPVQEPVASDSAFSPVADAYVTEAKPTANYGSATSLQSDTSPNTVAYLRFDVSGVGAPVRSAMLRVYVTNGTPDGPYVALAANSDWSESGLTWANKPAVGDPAGDTGSVKPRAWLEYDVTSLVQGNGAYTFALVPQSSDGLYINSREAAIDAPELVVTTGSGEASNPVPATPAPTWTPTGETAVLLAAGDISTCSNNGDEQTAQILDREPGTIAALGDIVYEEGTLQQFQDCYSPTWGRHKDRTRPIPGNHEYKTSGASGYYQYFGDAAGVSGQGYYSYNLGDWHIIALNSQISMSVGSAQERWLRADLAANPAQCTLAYWHEPLFSSGGSHGNSPETRPLFQALYEHGAEIVLAGHDHTYERFAPQTANAQADPQYGIREFVVGTGGRSVYNFGAIQPNSEARNNTSLGVLKLTLSPGGYSWEFLPVAGASYTDSGSGDCHDAPGSAVAVDESEQASRTSMSPEAAAVTGADVRRQHVVGSRRLVR